MRSMLLRACVVLFACAMPVAASAQSGTAAEQAQVAALLAQYPGGGQALADAIAQAVEADPSLANAVVAAAITADPGQQSALGTGLAEAAVFFANSNSPGAQQAQQTLQAAMAGAPTATLTAFNSGGGATALLATLSTGGTTITTNNCVSPSAPGNGC